MKILKIFLFTFIFSSEISYATDGNYFGSCFPEEKSVTQSFAIDGYTNEAFGQNLRKISNNPEVIGAVISYYPSIGGDMRYQYKTEPNPVIGHQGLALQHKNGMRYFWGSLNKNFLEDSGNYAVRYRIENKKIVDVSIFKFFSNKKTNQSTSPAISFDQKNIVVKMSTKKGDEIRVFKLDDLTDGGDYSEKYITRFAMPVDAVPDNEKKAFQAIAADNSRIFALKGRFSVGEENLLYIFSISGKYLNAVRINFGEDDARLVDSGQHYEPESLSWIQENGKTKLVLQIAVGDLGKRKCRVYKTNIYSE